MILIDSNALVLFIVGIIDKRRIKDHDCLSIYDEQDFEELAFVLKDFNKVVVLPNVWTEVDNLLNKFSGNYKYPYLQNLIRLIKESSEVYLASVNVIEDYNLIALGLTDTLLLRHALDCDLLITSDSGLSDRAKSLGIEVFDLVKNKNERILKY